MLKWFYNVNVATLFCSGYVAFKKAVCKYFINNDIYICFRFSRLPMFTSKATNSLNDDQDLEILARHHVLLTQ